MSTCLDYCNSLMYGIADGLMQRLQAVQNAYLVMFHCDLMLYLR